MPNVSAAGVQIGKEKIRNEKKRKNKKRKEEKSKRKKKKEELEKKKQILYDPPVTGYTMEDLDGKRNSQVFIELQKPDKVGEAIFSQGQESVRNQCKNVSNTVVAR